MVSRWKGMLFGVLCAGSTLAQAGPVNTKSGAFNGSTWTATSTIVGQTSTATLAAGGSPVNVAQMPRYSGVVSLIMDYGAAGRFICSGSLLPDRQSILTAGHCVSGGAGTANPLSTTAYFYGGSNPDTVVSSSPASTAIGISQYFVNSGYTGEVIDQNDIAVLRLSQLAPAFATSYDIYTGTDLTGLTYNIAGYGQRSDVGGYLGANLGTGRLRQGNNIYDFRLGDGTFDGFFTDLDANGENFFGTADIGYSYLADFDNGLAANNASGLLAAALGASGQQFGNLGLGASEVSSAGGDSGGPEFFNNQIASVTSYGLTFGTAFGDVNQGLNSSWGEFNGFVPTFIHKDFIFASMVPETSTWLMMIAGMGLLGGVLRRRKPAFACA